MAPGTGCSTYRLLRSAFLLFYFPGVLSVVQLSLHCILQAKIAIAKSHYPYLVPQLATYDQYKEIVVSSLRYIVEVQRMLNTPDTA